MLAFYVFVGTYETTSLLGGADVCVQCAYYAAHQITAVSESEAGASDNGLIFLAVMCRAKAHCLRKTSSYLKIALKIIVEMRKKLK